VLEIKYGRIERQGRIAVASLSTNLTMHPWKGSSTCRGQIRTR